MADQNPLSPSAVIRALGSIGDHLGRADRERVSILIGLIGADGRIALNKVLAKLYAGEARKRALTLLRNLRQRIAEAAGDAKIAFALATDGQTRAAPAHRTCWFEGGDGAAEATAKLVAGETAGVERGAQDAVEIDPKRTVRFFVSYAHADHKAKDDLLKRLGHLFGSAKNYRLLGWQDGDILLDGKWHGQIQVAIAACDFGLLLVSPAFFASGYIKAYELPLLIAQDPAAPYAIKRIAAVALKPIVFDGAMDLLGVDEYQIFHDAGGKAYQQRGSANTRDAFALQLFRKIVEMLDANPPTPTGKRGKRGSDIASAPPPFPDRDDDLRRALRDRIDLDLGDTKFARTEGLGVSLDKLDDGAGGSPSGGERRDALDFLKDWALDAEGQPCCALLGEYGMGKTTTCMAFARDLLIARAKDVATPLPIFMDLRNLGDGAKAEPDLARIVETVLRKSWRGGHAAINLASDEVIRLVQQEGAIAIFDGLDEVLVHLSPAGGQRFTRELFRILPPLLWPRRRKPGTPGRPGRVLVTCRTHYFRTLRDQKTHLTAEDRDDVRGDDYRAFSLLPFTEAQIRSYLEQALPGLDIERVMETVRSVHNLPELAARPYTLSLIARHFPDIERMRLDGRKVTGVDLYRHMVLSWLERDQGKHQITADHKQRLMEHFAAALWRSGRRGWSVGDLEQWLIDFLEAHPPLAAHYAGRDRELLKEDLRTATFLVRAGEDEFRFAHTSLLEFFLAGYLHRALCEGRIADWDMPGCSREVLDFLAQMMVSGDGEAAVATLRSMRGAYRPRISELAFRFVLQATGAGYPVPSPQGFKLDGADLREMVIEGAAAPSPALGPPPQPSPSKAAIGFTHREATE
jgi:hypothetical protein